MFFVREHGSLVHPGGLPRIKLDWSGISLITLLPTHRLPALPSSRQIPHPPLTSCVHLATTWPWTLNSQVSRGHPPTCQTWKHNELLVRKIVNEREGFNYYHIPFDLRKVKKWQMVRSPNVEFAVIPKSRFLGPITHPPPINLTLHDLRLCF